MPNLTITDGMVPTAAQINANWRDQVVTTCTSASRPSGTEGQFIYETDTDLIYVYNTAWVQYGSAGSWTSYTPVLTQSAAVTKTVTYARYTKLGRQVTVNVTLAVTGAGASNNAVTVSLPFTAAASSLVVGSGFITDASATFNYPGIAWLLSTTTVAFIDASQGVANILGQTGSAFSAAFASGDSVLFQAVYESTT